LFFTQIYSLTQFYINVYKHTQQRLDEMTHISSSLINVMSSKSTLSMQQH